MDEKVLDFLIKAKKSTYAGKGEKAVSSRPNSHDSQYVDGELKYINTYLGRINFAGEEALWKDDIPFWAMNYVGRVISERFSDEFLKEAFFAVPRDYPYRGPKEFKNGQYLYRCNIDGNPDWFYGYEEILYSGEIVYSCAFHGGIVD